MMDVSEDGQGIFEHRARQRRCRKKCQTLEKDVRSGLHLICRSQLRVSSIVVGPWDFFFPSCTPQTSTLSIFVGKISRNYVVCSVVVLQPTFQEQGRH